MAAPTKLFLKFNEISDEWVVVDETDFPFGSGKTKAEAIASARVVSNADVVE